MIFLTLILLFNIQACDNVFYSKKNIQEKKYREAKIRWEKLLKSFPLPKNALKLQHKLSFPKKDEVKEGIYLHIPRYLCSDKERNIYVSDTRQHTILKFDSKGNYLNKIGKMGQAPREFFHPRYMAIDNDNNLIVHDTGNSRIQIFNPDGEYLKSFKIFKIYSTMATDKLDKFYFSYMSPDPLEPLIEVLNKDGQLIDSFGKRINFKYYSFAHNEIDISVNNNGEIYAAWINFPYVKRFSKDGKLLSEYEIKYKLIHELSKPNYKQKRTKQKVVIMPLINGIIAKENGFYLFLTYPRIEILEFNLKGEIINIFWKEQAFEYLASDFLVKEKAQEKSFYILQGSPEQKIEIFYAY